VLVKWVPKFFTIKLPAPSLEKNTPREQAGASCMGFTSSKFRDSRFQCLLLLFPQLQIRSRLPIVLQADLFEPRKICSRLGESV
jgi:hypothetical protein